MNKQGGFGGPLCAEPYGDEVQSIVKRLLADSDNDKSLAFNNFADPCPELTKKQLETMKGFDYADTKKTGGMFLRITQNGEVCTVDASVAKFARAVRTWKSGHYFYEPLVSGSHLFGVWVLPA